MSDVARIRLDEQIADPRAQNLIRAVITVYPRHGVVAFGEIGDLVKHLDLLVLRQRNRDRPLEFEAPDRFGTLSDESAVTLFALLQAPLDLGPLD